jgi:hypothetical protein
MVTVKRADPILTAAINSQNSFRWLLISLCLCWVGSYPRGVLAANPPPDPLPDAPAQQTPVTEKGLPLAILRDQLPIWSSPIRIRAHDLIWLLPLGAATGVTLSTDTETMREVSRNRGFNKDSVNASNSLLASQIAIPVTLYGIGVFKANAHARATGILSARFTTMPRAIFSPQCLAIISRFPLPIACWPGLWQE